MRNLTAFVTVLVALLASVKAFNDAEYCEKSLCPQNKHVACISKWYFHLSCPEDAKLVKINAKLRKIIVDKHNKDRNYIASGADHNYDPACRMATMKWNDELAKLATLNVLSCQLNRDCHNTKKFTNSGQNSASITFLGKSNTAHKIKKLLSMWFSEVGFGNRLLLESYHSDGGSYEFSHFAAMINEKNTDVGCAIAVFTAPDEWRLTQLLFTCNYATNNVIGESVYSTCNSATADCETGRNPKYPFLCSPAEIYQEIKDYVD